MAFLSTRTWQFTYYALQLGGFDWKGKHVLDFGGNNGNILRDPNSTIQLDHYWCLDVVPEAVELGRRTYPEAHWLHYDRYCFFFNPHGTPRLRIPPLEQEFDYILAYSVFTNTPRSEMFDLVPQLLRLLKRDGLLAFSFIDPHYNSWPRRYNGNNLRWRLEQNRRAFNPAIDVDGLTTRARDSRWCILVNDDDLYIENERIRPYEADQQKTHHVFYTAEYIQSLYPGATIQTPVNGEMQHCCLLSAAHS